MLFVHAIARFKELCANPHLPRMRYHSGDSLAILQGAIKQALPGVIMFPGKPHQ